MLYGIVSMIHFLYIYARFTTTTSGNFYSDVSIYCVVMPMFHGFWAKKNGVPGQWHGASTSSAGEYNP
ncbi:hypothetical protein SAMN05661012_01262 [Chitinophaga sancti]|uniref:Uncharacterized protein n=1 Tax=Chitinophaga sancti TaxID=1004 RepID=A0A1K1NF37_9BACT|nr:hypothetical protein SAMN05661012_01262 [Chitinophaga sancti]